MTTVRSDALDLLSECQILIHVLRADDQPETRRQNLDRLERILDMLATSLEEG